VCEREREREKKARKKERKEIRKDTGIYKKERQQQVSFRIKLINKRGLEMYKKRIFTYSTNSPLHTTISLRLPCSYKCFEGYITSNFTI